MLWGGPGRRDWGGGVEGKLRTRSPKSQRGRKNRTRKIGICTKTLRVKRFSPVHKSLFSQIVDTLKPQRERHFSGGWSGGLGGGGVEGGSGGG